MSLDEISPRTYGEDRIKLSISTGQETARAFRGVLVDVDYSAARPEGVVLPLELTVQGPSGFDQVRAIATAEPISLLASDFGGRPGTTFRSLDRIQTRDLSVSIKSARDKVAPSKWAEDVIAVEVNR